MPLSVSSAVKQLSDGNTNGTILGRSPTDFIGFYGVSQGVVQPSGAAQAALTRGIGGGIIATGATSQSPGGITPQSTNEVSLTLGVTTQAGTGSSFALLSTDFVMANKPSQVAGMGVGNVRYATSQTVAVAFSNFTSATVTATAGDKWGIVALRGLPFITQTITPASVAASTTAEQIFNVTGVRVGEAVAVSAPSTVTNVNIAGVRVAGPNQVGITFSNVSPTTATTPPAGQYTIWSTGGIDTASNLIDIQANVGNLGGPTGTAVGTVSFTITGLTTSDVAVGVSKPTTQANFMYGTSYISAANLLGVSYWNPAATVTPTTYEVYGVSMWRAAPAAPAVVYQQALTPASVPPNTTTSQVFTVTGVVASSMVWVNKPSSQPGLGIAGFRATSNANQVEITYANATAATITPTAGETYTIANFQQAVPDAGTTWIYQLTPQMQQMAILDNAIRAALTGTNLIAGA